MGRFATYNVAFKRRREGKTNYRSRRRSVLSEAPRLVTRGSLKHMIAQVVVAKTMGDLILVCSVSNELAQKFGWKAPSGNIPSAYLTGLIVGYRAQLKKIQSVILDIGLQTPSKGSRVFAVLKGAIDAGLKVSHNKKILPEKARIRGEHIALYARQLSSSNPELYGEVFSAYLSKSLMPERLAEHFDQVLEKINETYKVKIKG